MLLMCLICACFCFTFFFFFFKQKTAYEMRISDWSSDVCSSDLFGDGGAARIGGGVQRVDVGDAAGERDLRHVADEALELLVLRNEVGFAVHFDHRAAVAVGGDADEAFGGDAAGLLGGGGEALGAEPVDRRFDVARSEEHKSEL